MQSWPPPHNIPTHKDIDNLKKVPLVHIDNSLEQYIDRPRFQDKIDKANEILEMLDYQK